MPSGSCERAISEALASGRALLKFVSANDAGVTGSHQAGFYLPKAAWEMYAPFGPVAGRLDKHGVDITWPDGIVRESVVTWYGQKTRSEYRLTRFGKGFPFLTPDSVGSLLVLIPERLDVFKGHVFDLEDDIEAIQAALGVQLVDTWGIYDRGGAVPTESEGECVDRRFTAYADAVDGFPTGDEFSAETMRSLEECVGGFRAMPADALLMRCVEAEYALFRMVERRLCGPEISQGFRSVEDFIETAARIMNRRKSRAGRSLENHAGHVLRSAGIPFDVRPQIEGRPDIVIPGKREYDDPAYPEDRLFVVGVKTTCKDRWGQVTKEARRVRHKHILTTQRGIAGGQLHEMHAANVSLVVPKSIHPDYPRERDIEMLTVEQFIGAVRDALRL
jgi:type II restriction enzyme